MIAPVTSRGLLNFHRFSSLFIFVYFPSTLGGDIENLSDFCPAGLWMVFPVLYQETVSVDLSHSVIFCHNPMLPQLKGFVKGVLTAPQNSSLE